MSQNTTAPKRYSQKVSKLNWEKIAWWHLLKSQKYWNCKVLLDIMATAITQLNSLLVLYYWFSCNLLRLMHAIACTHTSTHATSLMLIKNCMHHLCLTLIFWDIRTKKMKEKTKKSNLIVDHFSLTFVNLLLAWILYFHVLLQNKGKFLVWIE